MRLQNPLADLRPGQQSAFFQTIQEGLKREPFDVGRQQTGPNFPTGEPIRFQMVAPVQAGGLLRQTNTEAFQKDASRLFEELAQFRKRQGRGSGARRRHGFPPEAPCRRRLKRTRQEEGGFVIGPRSVACPRRTLCKEGLGAKPVERVRKADHFVGSRVSWDVSALPVHGLAKVRQGRRGRNFLRVVIRAPLVGQHQTIARRKYRQEEGVAVRIADTGIARVGCPGKRMPFGPVVFSGKRAVIESRDEHHPGRNSGVLAQIGNADAAPPPGSGFREGGEFFREQTQEGFRRQRALREAVCAQKRGENHGVELGKVRSRRAGFAFQKGLHDLQQVPDPDGKALGGFLGPKRTRLSQGMDEGCQPGERVQTQPRGTLQRDGFPWPLGRAQHRITRIGCDQRAEAEPLERPSQIPAGLFKRLEFRSVATVESPAELGVPEPLDEFLGVGI